MLLDQSLFAPVMIWFFFSGSETLTGKRPHEIKQMLQERYVQTLITNYKIWPLAQTLNIIFVPVQPVCDKRRLQTGRLADKHCS